MVNKTMGRNEKKSKVDHLVVSSVSTSNDLKTSSKVLCHIRILYSLWVLLACGLGASIWLGHIQIQRLREDLQNEIHLQSRSFVEFNPELQQDHVQYSGPSIPDGGEDLDENELTDSAEKEHFLRVKRRARRHGGHKKIPPKEEQPVYLHEKEGSGLPEDWVWLTSYSRIPVFALQEFCSTAQGQCPAGPPGPQGPPGIQGFRGEAGVKGDTGTLGLQGPQGYNGTKGEKGEPGSTGLVGADGQKGDTGEVGEKGAVGESGVKGESGHRGHKGEPGLPGFTGEKGDRGEIGEKGNRGDTGLPGLIGQKGEMGEQGFNGTDVNIDGLTKTIIASETLSDGRLKSLSLCGGCPPGAPGIPGLPGRPGPAGPPGIEGPSGFNGTKGNRGKRGRKGDVGPSGFQGQQGRPGEKGEMGMLTEANCTCAVGPKGEKGARGLIGFIGYQGDKGERGPPGAPGPYNEGLPGPRGLPGQGGAKGQKGDRGEPGRSNLVLETTRAPDTTTISSTTTPAPTTIRRSTTQEPTLPPRTQKCIIRMVGKPLFQRYTGTYWGTWMKDPLPREPGDETKFWFSRHFTGKIISEYDSVANFQRDIVDETIELQELYFGTGHVVYNGFLFYHKAGYSEIIKFDLKSRLVEGQVVLPDANYQDKENYLYSTEYNFFDMAVDENGLWAIYGSAVSRSSLLVSKINHVTMQTEKTLNITVNHQEYGNGFITCGVLYLVKDTHRKSTFIDFAYDLYEEKKLAVRLTFSNPYQMNNMIAYNPKEKRIYCWDKGNQLYYPLLT